MTTYNGYEIMVRLHVEPAIGRRYLVDLSPVDVRRMLADLRTGDTDGHGGGPRKLSARMVQFAHAVPRNALSNAVREELVSRNVAKVVKTSTPDYTVGASLDPLAAWTLLAQIADDRLVALYPCAIVLGMRRGELLGPTWSAVDLTAYSSCSGRRSRGSTARSASSRPRRAPRAG